MKISRIMLLFLIAFTLSSLPALSQMMPQDYWYVQGVWGSGGSGDGQFSWPYGIAVETNGFVYVADSSNNRIQVFQSDGTFVRKWGSGGSGDGQLGAPLGIAVGATGLVFVADTSNQRIQVFQLDGTFVRKWGSGGSGDGQFSSPCGIAMGMNGQVYVTDANNRIQVFQSDGTFVRKWGSSGSGDGQFNNPRGIAVGTNGQVYVTDASNRIQVFQSDGTFVRKWTCSGTLSRIAVDKNGLVFVINGSFLQVFQSDGAILSQGGVGSSIIAYGIAVGANDLVYILDVWSTSTHSIRVFRRGYRAPATGMPLPGAQAVTQRVGVAYVDIDFTVWDSDSSNVQVVALGWSNGVVSLDRLVRLDTLLEGTSNNVGTSIAANVPHRITWDAGADWKVSSGSITFEILANDGRPMVDFHFITIPSNGPDPELEIERFPMREADFQSCWYWLIATRDPAVDFRTNKVYGVGGGYDNKLLAQTTTTTADGRAFLYERLHVREATAAEVNRVRAGTSGTINQWTPRYSTDRRTKYNEFGFDSAYTQGASVWYVVPNP